MGTTGNFAVLAVVGWLLMHGSTAADENPWMAIREQAIALAKEAHFDWEKDKQQDAARARFRGLAKSRSLPLQPLEVAALVEHIPTIVLPKQVPFDVAGQQHPDGVVQTLTEQSLVCSVAMAGVVKGMPESERTSYQFLIDRGFTSIWSMTSAALAAISMADDAESKDWLHRFVFQSDEKHWLHRENVPYAIPLLVGAGRRTLSTDLKKLLAVEKAKATANKAAGEHYMKASLARRRAGAIVNAIETTMSAENYCQTLELAQQRLFRDFYVRLHQAWACAPKGFRSGETRTAEFAVDIMIQKPTDTQFYLSFLQDWQASDVELYCISALYWKNGPMDVEELRKIAAGETSSAYWATGILQQWDK